jgi:UDP-N-acetylglucosamine 2-epimerase
LAIFEIKPDYDLNIMKQEQDLYDVTARFLLGLSGFFTTGTDIALISREYLNQI